MTIQTAKKRLADIASQVDDKESAHGAEDAFREEVLQHIADGGKDAQALAKLALQTNDIEFERWYA